MKLTFAAAIIDSIVIYGMIKTRRFNYLYGNNRIRIIQNGELERRCPHRHPDGGRLPDATEMDSVAILTEGERGGNDSSHAPTGRNLSSA